MKALPVTAICLCLFGPAVKAADVPLYAPYIPPEPLRGSHDWTGGYAGVHAGYGFGKTRPSSVSGGGAGPLGGVLGSSVDISGGLLSGLLGGLGLDGLVGDILDTLDLEGLLGGLLGDIGGGITEELLGVELEGVLGAELSLLDLDLGLRGSDFETEPEGFLGGGQIGYNVQQGAFVFGVEADIAATDMTDSSSFSGAGSIVAASAELLDLEIAEVALDVETTGEIESELNWLSTLRGRFGFAVDRVLVYGTGGVAFGDMDIAANLTTSISGTVELLNTEIIDIDIPASTLTGSGGGLLVGYTIGAGLEYAINDNWAARLEYAYINFGDVEIDFDDGSLTDMEVDMHLVKGGVNYYF